MGSLETIRKDRMHLLKKLRLNDLLESSRETSPWKDSGVSGLRCAGL